MRPHQPLSAHQSGDHAVQRLRSPSGPPARGASSPGAGLGSPAPQHLGPGGAPRSAPHLRPRLRRHPLFSSGSQGADAAAESLRRVVQDVLIHLFGQVPGDLNAYLAQERDPAQLRRWVIAALDSEDLGALRAWARLGSCP